MTFLGISYEWFLKLRTFLSDILNYGGFNVLTLKLRITDLPLSTTKITEVSVFFTDGWQHCVPQGSAPAIVPATVAIVIPAVG